MQVHHSQEEPEGFSHGQPRVSREYEAELEDYLDHLTAEMVGVVPYRRRRELREEIRAHLLALAEAYEELGSSSGEALAQALEQFGEPRTIARQWVDEWRPRHSRRFCAARATAAPDPLRLRAGLLSAVPWIAIPSVIAWRLAFDGSWQPQLLNPELVFIWPVLSGALTGYLGRGSRAAGTCLAVALSTFISTLFLSLAGAGGIRNDLLQLVVLQFFGWIPLATISAALAGWLRDWQDRGLPARE